MREIKFRAMDARLPKEKVHWIYGAFVKHLPYTPAPIDTPPIPDSDYEYAIVNDAFSDWQMPRDLQITPVYPETVGEFTGLHDKNGREVYEGDIVHVWDNGVAVVIFDESLGRGQWMCKFKPAFPDWDEWSAPLYGWLEGNVDGSVFEILGNVYETPELMEVTKHDDD